MKICSRLLDETHNEESAKIKMLYMESVKKPTKLLKHVRSLTKKGCIFVGIKSGVTDDGKRAAASHTGALASSDTAVQALFDKAGIVRVRSKYELVELFAVTECIKRQIERKESRGHYGRGRTRRNAHGRAK